MFQPTRDLHHSLARELQVVTAGAILCRINTEVGGHTFHMMGVTLQSVPRSSTLGKTYAYHQICRVAIAIITYFRRHPNAKDNLEGIALWWVDEERDLVVQSLSMLIDLGTVKKEHDLYSLADSLRSERSELLLERLVEELRQKMQQ